MELNFPPCLLQGAKSGFECDRTSDAGYFSACGSISPSSSIDSGCFSPPASCWGAGSVPAKKPREADGKRRSRSRNPGTKRQTASEREKLRMRDLTKALHHLRTFLPASVAPAGQSLTKIETLRLTIRYISYLSAQLEQSEETFKRQTRCYSQETSDGLLSETWCPEPSSIQGFSATDGEQLPSNFRDAQSCMFPHTITQQNAIYSHQSPEMI